jgi:hypothetical protein
MNVSETIFDDKIKLIMRLQTSAYAADNFQNWRSELINDCLGLVASLNTDIFYKALRSEAQVSTGSKDQGNQ